MVVGSLDDVALRNHGKNALVGSSYLGIVDGHESR